MMAAKSITWSFAWLLINELTTAMALVRIADDKRAARMMAARGFEPCAVTLPNGAEFSHPAFIGRN